MGLLTLYIAASLDGYIAAEDGGVEWLETFEDTYEDGEPDGSFEAFYDGVDCLVMGATTYEQVLTFGEWPYGDDRTIVATRRELPRASPSVEFHAGGPEELVRDVADAHDRIWLVGGAALARAFLERDLIDEIRLSVIPVLLGSGISLFGDSGIDRALHLTDATAYENGIVELHYEVGST